MSDVDWLGKVKDFCPLWHGSSDSILSMAEIKTKLLTEAKETSQTRTNLFYGSCVEKWRLTSGVVSDWNSCFVLIYIKGIVKSNPTITKSNPALNHE